MTSSAPPSNAGHLTDKAKPSCRGTIIVDASALFMTWRATGKGHNPEGREWRYFDILPFLASSGFRVIIPEMVAFETSRVLAGGECVDHAFIRRSITTYRQDMENFLMDVARGAFPNIIMPTAQGPTEVKDTLESIGRALYAHRKGSPGSIAKIIRAQAPLREKDREIDYGDEAIKYLLSHRQSIIDPAAPVFVLTDDINFLGRIAREDDLSDVKFVTPRSFFKAIQANNLYAWIPCLNSPRAIEQLAHAALLSPEYDGRVGDHPKPGSEKPFDAALRQLAAGLDYKRIAEDDKGKKESFWQTRHHWLAQRAEQGKGPSPLEK